MVAKSVIALTLTFLIVLIFLQINAGEKKIPVLTKNESISLKEWNLKFDKMIKTSVKKEAHPVFKTNLVDYKSLVNNKSFNELGVLLKSIGTEKASEKECLATWLNIYNYLAIKKVVDNFGIKKLSDLDKGLSKVWKQDAGSINGIIVSLDTVEHKIIRGSFKEERVHFALVCAALSCPDLRIEAYTGDKVENQLKDQVIKFFKNDKKGIKIDSSTKTIYITKIMKWFSGDFGDVKKWLHLNGVITKDQVSYRLKYLDYDWNINSL